MSRLPFPMRDSVDDFYMTDEFYDFLGQGTFASVYKAVCCMDTEKVRKDEEVALKLIPKRDLQTEKAVTDIINEVEVLRRVDHCNCVRLLDYFQTATHVVIVMNLVEGKELFRALRENDFSEACARKVMEQLLSALAYLHDKLNVVHRDIKPENILVSPTESGEYHVTIVDFGLARTFGRTSSARRIGKGAFVPMQRLLPLPPRSGSMESLSETDSPISATPCGTLKYAAPETVHSISESQRIATTRTLLPRVDVYAAGLIMYAMLSGALPFSNFTNKESLWHEMTEKGPSFVGPRWENVSHPAIDVNRDLLLSDPTKRPRATDALQYPWFKGAEGPGEMRSQCSSSLRMPVDTIIGERAAVADAFNAMRPPETAGYNHRENEEVYRRGSASTNGRVVSVPFGAQRQQHVQNQPSSYFDV